MEIKIELNLPDDNNDALERINQAQQAKSDATETIQDAWKRIMGMKNSKADVERLKEVYTAMKAGDIGRNPDDVSKRFSKAEALRLWRELNEAKREQRLKDLVASTPANYHLVQNEKQLATLLADLRSEPIIAIDTETTGVDVYADKIVGISFTLPKKDYHVYIPIRHVMGLQLSPDYVLNQLKPFLESPRTKKVLHNARFDMHILLTAGIDMQGVVWDTMIAMHVLNENEKQQGSSFRLKDLATKYLKEPSDTFATLFGKTPFAEVPLDVALVYAGKDTHLTWKLYEFQLMHLQKQPELLKYYQEIEQPTITVVMEMERVGFIIDTKFAHTFANKLRTEIDELHAQLIATFGDINFGSPKQLGEKLYDEMGLHKHLPPTWKRSTDSDTIKFLANHNDDVALLLAYRERTKLLSTYVEALPKQVKAFDRRVHGGFNQTGTVTGRFSSNNPNLQNQPKRARKLFVAPKGSVIIGFDFSQQEPRLLAHFTGEEGLVESYKRGEDLYTKMASAVFGVPESECGDKSKYRKMMKFGVLSVMYGTSAKTLATQIKVTVAEAEKFIEDFYQTYPKVAKWVEANKEYARTHGYVKTLFGRKRRLKEAKSKDKWTRFRAERQTTNARIQGSASEQTKLTLIAMQKWCAQKRAEGREFWICATIHDENLVYAPADITYAEFKELEGIMLNTVKLAVPNKTDAEVMTRWGEGMTYEEFATGEVKRENYEEEEDYVEQLRIVKESWQGALVA